MKTAANDRMTNENGRTVSPVPDDWRTRTVLDVPTGGALFDLSRSASYRAAQTGDLPTIRLGRRLVVPVAQVLAMLEGPAA